MEWVDFTGKMRRIRNDVIIGKKRRRKMKEEETRS
jgi:hypothetical protein